MSQATVADQQLLIDKSDGVLTLTFNRPDKKNAITWDMYVRLAAAVDSADADKDVRCILFQANGDIFTAGNDLGEFAKANAGDPEMMEKRKDGNPLPPALARCQTPMVAAVNGRAVGIGATLLLHCDLVYVTPDAVLTTPFVNLALVPEAASSIQMPARIGHARAFAMFVLGEPVDAEKAVAWGIANEIVPASEVRAKALAAARAVAAKPARAVALTRALMRDTARLVARTEEERQRFTEQLQSAEAKEAFAAFAEKRAPDFSKIS